MALLAAVVGAMSAPLPSKSPSDPSYETCRHMTEMHGVQAHITWGTLPKKLQPRWVELGCDDIPEATCDGMAAMYGVKAGVTWGSLPASLQNHWVLLGCDETCDTMAAAHGVQAHVTWGRLPENLKSRWASIGCDETCESMGAKYGVQAHITWGRLPPNFQLRWIALLCDAIAPSGGGHGTSIEKATSFGMGPADPDPISVFSIDQRIPTAARLVPTVPSPQPAGDKPALVVANSAQAPRGESADQGFHHMAAARDDYVPRQIQGGPEKRRDPQEEGAEPHNLKVVDRIPSHASASSESRAPSQPRTALLPSSAPTAWRPTERREGRTGTSMQEMERQVESTGNDDKPMRVHRPSVSPRNWAPW